LKLIGNWVSKLEEYVAFSATYPDRLELIATVTKTQLDEYREMSETQFGYYRFAQNPNTLKHYMFFENEEHATMARMIIEGEYQQRVFK
jgi:metal-responsive CopG/Arc/MetJ family transcriptional regulator